MKKLISILLVSLFFVSITGFTIITHYCDGKLVDIAISLTANTSCDDNGCCKDEFTSFQLEEEAVALQLVELNHEFSFEITLFPIEQFELASQDQNIDFDDLTQLKLLDYSVDLADIQSFRL